MRSNNKQLTRRNKLKNNKKTLQQLDKASELLYMLSYAIKKGLTNEMDQSWIDSAKKLSREIDNHLKEITQL